MKFFFPAGGLVYLNPVPCLLALALASLVDVYSWLWVWVWDWLNVFYLAIPFTFISLHLLGFIRLVFPFVCGLWSG